MKVINLILILFLMLPPLPVFSQDDTTGSICIAPVPQPNDRPISLANPSGGNRSFNFTIRVDQQARVLVDHEKSILISDLAIKGDRNLGSDLIIEFNETTPNGLLANERLRRITDKSGSQ